MHSWDHADSEYMLYWGVDRKWADFTNNKHIHSYSDAQLYISVQIYRLHPCVFEYEKWGYKVSQNCGGGECGPHKRHRLHGNNSHSFRSRLISPFAPRVAGCRPSVRHDGDRSARGDYREPADVGRRQWPVRRRARPRPPVTWRLDGSGVDDGPTRPACDGNWWPRGT